MVEILSDTESENFQENIYYNEPSVSREASNKENRYYCDHYIKSYKAAKDNSTSTLRGHIAYEHKQLNSEISTSGPLDKFVKSKTALAFYNYLFDNIEEFQQKNELSTDMNDAINVSIQKLNDYYPTSDGLVYIVAT
ncbi:7114_t:CDS:2, partial [Diversispora eburnea]